MPNTTLRRHTMLEKFGKLVLFTFGAVTTVLGIAGWADDAAVWHGWLKGMNPVLSGFLMGVGTTSIIVFLVARFPSIRYVLGLTTPQDRSQEEPVRSRRPDVGKPILQQGAAPNPCPRTPEQLVESVKGRTEVSATLAIKPFVGTLLSFSGSVTGVEEHGLSRIAVSIDVSEHLWAIISMKEGGDDEDYLVSLNTGDYFSATGALSSVSYFDASERAVIHLRDGELVKTA